MKALVVGGSNGVGLAIVNQLIARGYLVSIIDKTEPDNALQKHEACCFYPCDLRYLDEELIRGFAADREIDVLVITAGFGRVADFEYFHTAEIENMISVNTIATLQILRIFYERIKTKEKFFCCVMGSISGILSSPSAAIYAASKAAVFRFIESVNIELEMSGTTNRILNVSPASFKGSKFNGGNNQLELLAELSNRILSQLFNSNELYIPQYDEIYKAVIERYNNDPHEYGIHSYQYKRNSGRLDNNRRVKIGYLSGTFDLFHIGHVNLIKRAKSQCDYLIVGVHDSGSWKGKETFISFEDRKAVVASCRFVDKVVDSCLEDSEAWEIWHFDRLFVGSDYKGTERFNRYEKYFEDKGVEIVYFPYTNSTSSTQIRNSIKHAMEKE